MTNGLEHIEGIEGIEGIGGPCETCRHWSRLENLSLLFDWQHWGKCAFKDESSLTHETHRCKKWQAKEKVTA